MLCEKHKNWRVQLDTQTVLTSSILETRITRLWPSYFNILILKDFNPFPETEKEGFSQVLREKKKKQTSVTQFEINQDLYKFNVTSWGTLKLTTKIIPNLWKIKDV